MNRLTTRVFPWAKCMLGPAAFLAALLVAPPVCAQLSDFEKALLPSPFWEQTHVFRKVLFDLKFQPLDRIEVNPAETIVVVLGDSSILTRLPPGPEGQGLAAFLNTGGAVLLATDKGPYPRSVARDVEVLTGYKLQEFHYHFKGQPVDTVCYQKQDFCPFLVPVMRGKPDLFVNPDDQNRSTLKVATNLPGMLELLRPKPDNAHDLAHLPIGCVPEEVGAPDPPRNGSCVVSVESKTGSGRLLLIADHSIFINAMMLPDDNNNVEFAKNCMAWLSDNGKRKKVLFVEDGIIQSHFDVAIKMEPPKTPSIAERDLLKVLDKGLGHANYRLAQAEETDAFNYWIHRWLSKGDTASPWARVGVLLVLLTLVGLVAGFFRLVSHVIQHQSPMAPSLVRLVEIQQPTESLMEQRNRGMMQVGNMWEVGRQLARQVFEAAGIAGKTGDRLPNVTVQGGWLERPRLRRKVAFLWKLAYGKKPSPVPPSQWPGLLQQLDELRRALASGSVRLG